MPQLLKPIRPDMNADEYIGARLRAHREAQGLTQAALGAAALMSRSSVHMIETGERPLRPEHAERIDKHLSTRGELAALADLRQHGLLLSQEDPMDASRRAFLGLAGLPAVAAADKLGRSMQAMLSGGLPSHGIEEWEDALAGHTSRYTVTPPGQLLSDMLPDLAAIHQLTSAHPYQRDLASVAARMAGLTGALLTDLGEVGKARHWLSILDGYAAQAGDTRTRTWGSAARAVLDTYYATPAQVITLTSRTIPAAQGTASAGLVMLHGLRSRALAAQGQNGEAVRALETAAAIHARLAEADAEDYMWGFPVRQLRWYESRTYTLTGDVSRAGRARAEAIRLYPPDDQVDRILLLLDGAACSLASGAPDQAAADAAQALASVPADRRTTVVAKRAAELARSLASYQYLSHTREFDEVRTNWTIQPE
jgi:transcriptional regulator with XRE-family HTH domain